MTKLRVLIFLSTILVVGIFGTLVSYYARGYRFNIKTLKFQPNGILVVKSEPDGASVIINGDLRTATNATISLAPGTYDVEVKKEGYISWYKRLTIEKEIVTQAGVSLFKTVPSLSPVTFSGAQTPIQSEDGGKIAYIDKEGLWINDISSLPLGFSRGPKRVTDGNLTNASFEFSPDGNQILLSISNGIFLLDSNTYTSQAQRVNVASKQDEILADWNSQRKIIETAHLQTLPLALAEVFSRKVSKLSFAPDETMILYTASSSAVLDENLVKQLPGASTQKQERIVKGDQTYVYDIKEDRNFLISDNENPVVKWLPTSRHLLLSEEGKIVIMDYDGTNRQEIYTGSYIYPFAYPFSNSSKILILTNLGSDTSTPNLYSLTIK
jgi:dipeptidyl aminopeptidase/acylaminoacyl peptidase